jgi:hypothetical protein
MRTTVTLDKDVEKMLRDAMHNSNRSFKELLNAAIRAGLSKRASAIRRGDVRSGNANRRLAAIKPSTK